MEIPSREWLLDHVRDTSLVYYRGRILTMLSI
jgi:hypothetical protein